MGRITYSGAPATVGEVAFDAALDALYLAAPEHRQLVMRLDDAMGPLLAEAQEVGRRNQAATIAAALRCDLVVPDGCAPLDRRPY